MIYDTHTMTLHQDDLSFPNGEEFNWEQEQVETLVNHAVSNSEMKVTTPLDFKNFGVSEIFKGICYSKAAYIESDIGYFIISTSMMSHIVVTYSRWD